MARTKTLTSPPWPCHILMHSWYCGKHDPEVRGQSVSSAVTLHAVLIECVLLKEHVRVLGHMHHTYSSPDECIFFSFVFFSQAGDTLFSIWLWWGSEKWGSCSKMVMPAVSSFISFSLTYMLLSYNMWFSNYWLLSSHCMYSYKTETFVMGS